MTDGLVERNRRLGSVAWHENRLVTALQIIAFLPGKPGVTLDEIIDHVEKKRRTTYLILGAIERSGIRIGRKNSAGKRTLFFLPPQSQKTIDLLFRLK